MTNGIDIKALLEGAIAEADRQQEKIFARDVLAPGHQWRTTPPGQAFLDGEGDSNAAFARRITKGLRIPCATYVGGCGNVGYVETHDKGYVERTLCPLCLGAEGGVWSSGGRGFLEALKAAWFPTRHKAATDEAMAAFNADAKVQHEARQEAARIEREKRERAERVRDIIAEADPEMLARALGAMPSKPVSRK
jgi:hypothetical protein